MKRLLYIPAVLLALTACGSGVRKTAHGFRAEGALSRFEVVCYAPDIVQVVKAPLYGKMVTEPTASVVLNPGKVRFEVDVPDEGTVRLTTDSLQVDLDLASGVFSFRKADGSLLVQEQPEAVSHEEIHQGFLLEEDEAVYGLGQHKGSGMDQRGKQYHLENANTEIAIPLFHSVKGYAVYWDN